MGWIGLANLLLTTALVAPAQPAFEVASIKQHALPRGTFAFGPGGGGAPIRIEGNRVTLSLNTLVRLVMSAYNVKDFQVSGVPDWARDRDQLYDIVAKSEGEATPSLEQVRPMLQTLLADRFRLKLHRETRELPVYDLVVGKNGPKFKESTGPRPQQLATFSGPLMRLTLLDRPMADLIQVLGNTVDRPVLDKTGLTGKYDFTLEVSRSNPDLVAPGSPEADRSIFSAVQDQLGLKLAPAKESTEMLVIDRAERPSAN